MALQVIIVDDESSARDRVRDLLAEEPDIAIAAECSSGREAIATITALRADLLFLDIQMPEVNGFDVRPTINMRSKLLRSTP
jgi:two-component system, LytTR family, response regulator